MKKSIMSATVGACGVFAISLAGLSPALASDDSRIKFPGGIAPGGHPWVIEKLWAFLCADGAI